MSNHEHFSPQAPSHSSARSRSLPPSNSPLINPSKNIHASFTPHISPIHLPISSARAYGAASRQITNEARFPTFSLPTLPDTKNNILNLSYSTDESDPFSAFAGDLSYPSVATSTSHPRGILHRRTLTPHNTPNTINTPSSLPSSRSVVQSPLLVAKQYLTGGIDERYALPNLVDSLQAEFDPLPFPRFKEVRQWLSHQLKTTAYHQYHKQEDLVPHVPQKTHPATPPPLLPTYGDQSPLLNTSYDTAYPNLPNLSRLSLDDSYGLSWMQKEAQVEDEERFDRFGELAAQDDTATSDDVFSRNNAARGMGATFAPQTNEPPLKDASERRSDGSTQHTREENWQLASPSPVAWKAVESKGKLPLKFGRPLPSHFLTPPDGSSSPFVRFYSSQTKSSPLHSEVDG